MDETQNQTVEKELETDTSVDETQETPAEEAQEPAQASETKTPKMDRDAMDDHIKGVIEAILFVHEKPVTLEQLRKVLKTVKPAEIKNAISQLQGHADSYDSGINIVEIAGGYQLLTNKKYASYIRDFYKTRHKEKLSKPSLETMAIIAYKQPVTRADIEVIRGVNCDGVVAHLLNKELIKIVGRKDVPGKPYLYGTTKQFMEYFGLRSLDDLPKLEEFTKMQPEYEKGTNAPVEDDPTIPQEAFAMNSLEQAKQSAIKNSEEREASQTSKVSETSETSEVSSQNEDALDQKSEESHDQEKDKE